ncbi:hypothetical protein WMY93_004073 [Mugilogobius chulae]|uniref:Uncharacterized protein n=1 Tax=Mugilogobius chulae TaxID=88201 RepID=A0AAW0PNM5_9GOBI
MTVSWTGETQTRVREREKELDEQRFHYLTNDLFSGSWTPPESPHKTPTAVALEDSMEALRFGAGSSLVPEGLWLKEVFCHPQTGAGVNPNICPANTLQMWGQKQLVTKASKFSFRKCDGRPTCLMM